MPQHISNSKHRAERRTSEETDIEEYMVRRRNDASTRLGGIGRVDDEHTAPEDRPVPKCEDRKDRDDTAVFVPERGASVRC